MNHRWKDNVCMKCGVKRKRKTSRLLMAITNHPPYNHYLYEQYWFYSGANISGKGTKIRPNCFIYPKVRQKVLDVIDTVKAQYPTSIFPNAGTSPDAKAAMMARLICDNIKREMEIMFNEEPAPSSTPQSVEGILKEKYFDEMKADGQNESACKQGWIILYGLNSYLQKALPKAMQEYGNQLVVDKEREIEEWKHAADSFELTAKEFKKEIQFLNDRNEYWKARCLACERYSENSDYREENYEEWQALKQQPIK